MDTVWVAVAFFIFVGIVVYTGAHKKIIGALDARGELVAKELAEARRLRHEAETLLAEFEAKRKAAEAEAESIVAAAKDEAERLAKDAEEKLADFVARRTKAAEDKIAQAESQATSEVRAAVADAATLAAEAILRGQVAGKAGADLIASGLNDVRSKLN
ncbi:ATP F0F1 synthase subunit B [Bosea sp. TWI1241]|jgi:F-type H+-transporting ATPase subunit b|uniref:F0F1 ATP synthase subunit B family protein n=1 Tax=Bosea sp. TWI1241 TaxID=3148904 RepID=UPI00320A488C